VAQDDLKQRIRNEAQSLGFSTVGFSPATLPDSLQKRFHTFLADGRHGEMDWLTNRSGQRTDPQSLWPAARSVIVLGVNYGPDSDPMQALERKSSGAISVYAQNKDYHDIIKKRMKQLARWLVDQSGCELKVFVDTAPVMEKPLSAQGGIGWQGKHTNLVSREFGSWMFLGAIFTTLEFTSDAAEINHCGSCQNCLDICPTDAFPAPYQLDARRCISYLTIEHKGPIPVQYRKAMGNRIYGCDDCLAVCPWNKFASAAKETAFHAREELRSPPLEKLAALDDVTFRALFSGSPIKRTGRDRFVRNVLIAIGNSGNRALYEAAIQLLSDENPVVRGAAVWAVGQLAGETDRNALRELYAAAESDETVLQEWNMRVEN
jgi:epoxyqueuosine reductase